MKSVVPSSFCMWLAQIMLFISLSPHARVKKRLTVAAASLHSSAGIKISIVVRRRRKL